MKGVGGKDGSKMWVAGFLDENYLIFSKEKNRSMAAHIVIYPDSSLIDFILF